MSTRASQRHGRSALGAPVTVSADEDHLAVHLFNFGVSKIENSGSGLARLAFRCVSMVTQGES